MDKSNPLESQAIQNSVWVAGVEDFDSDSI